ncbi:molybdopterin-binding oxidoreductase [Streptosporangium oxazolinicum]|uniref:Molybdopterin-binding oxidoreductase n=1 Tax=Streptosporangium oxazolinicum TaxID=909287 RepID=A0ABP8AFC7_9ACTN
MSLRTRRNRRLIAALLLATTVPLTGTAAATTSTGGIDLGTATTHRVLEAAPAVKVRGDVAHPRSFTLARLRSLPQHTVRVRYQSSRGTEKHTFTGPLLGDVLALTKPRLDAETKNDQLRFFVAATGSDGYRAIVSLSELDPAFSGKKVLLAVSQDGASLDAEGPRLVVPGDVKGGRYVSGVVHLHVGDVDALVDRG